MQYSFQQFAQLKGINLLRDDIIFLRVSLSKVPYNARRSTLQRYAEIWVGAMRNCGDHIKKDNVGRAAANYWLRERIESQDR